MSDMPMPASSPTVTPPPLPLAVVPLDFTQPLARSERPRRIIIAGVLALALGAAGCLSYLFQLVMRGQFVHLSEHSILLQNRLIEGSSVQLLLLILCGVLLLKDRPVVKIWAVIYAAAAVVTTFASAYVLLQVMPEIMAGTAPAGANPQMTQSAQTGAMIGSIISSSLGLAPPSVLLWVAFCKITNDYWSSMAKR